VCKRQNINAKVIRTVENQADIGRAAECLACGLKLWEVFLVQVQRRGLGAWRPATCFDGDAIGLRQASGPRDKIYTGVIDTSAFKPG
jgi:hypothetical protein